MKKTNNSRYVASKILTDWIEKDFFPEKELSKLQKDRAFVMEVVYGCIRQYAILKWLLNKWVKKTPSNYSQAVIYVGFYQIMFMNNIEEFAAINETVEAAKNQPNGNVIAKFVNALLRRCQRDLRDIRAELNQQEISLQLSHPPELFDKWTDRYGPQKAFKLAEWNNCIPRNFLRVNQRKITMVSYKKKLSDACINFDDYDEKFIIIPRGTSIISLPGYDEGLFTVQDPATANAVDLLNPKEKEKILDACASPGGKSMIIAEYMNGGKGLTAMEIHQDRIPRLKENFKRCDLSEIMIIQGDARTPEKYVSDVYDGILCDAPCSNTGVLQRRVDARWRVDQNRIKKLNKLQTQILDGCARLLKSNGRLVYSTCSLEKEENEDLVASWLKSNSDFYLEKELNIFPLDLKTDGAYVALIRRC